MSLTVEVTNTKGQKVGSVDLSQEVFDAKAPKALVHEVVNAYLANRRRGTHSTKTRGEVSGGGVKPWKQKHTGNARAGSIRSPLWRHGGIIFGPKPRSYFQPIPVGKRRLALKAVLSSFAKDGKVRVIDAFQVSEPKTKAAAAAAAGLKLTAKTVLVMDKVDATLERASRNLANVRIVRAQDLNSYSALLGDELVFTKPALDEVTKRLTGGAAEAPAQSAGTARKPKGSKAPEAK